jgi:hypothetical protein
VRYPVRISTELPFILNEILLNFPDCHIEYRYRYLKQISTPFFKILFAIHDQRLISLYSTDYINSAVETLDTWLVSCTTVTDILL